MLGSGIEGLVAKRMGSIEIILKRHIRTAQQIAWDFFLKCKVAAWGQPFYLLSTCFINYKHEGLMRDMKWSARWNDTNLSLPASLSYKSHLSRPLNCWSLRCSWSIACRRYSNYIFILYSTPGFNRLGKDKCKARWISFRFWDLVRLILEIYGNFFFKCVRSEPNNTFYLLVMIFFHYPTAGRNVTKLHQTNVYQTIT